MLNPVTMIYPPTSSLSVLLSKLKLLKDEGKYCDVVLDLGDKTVAAHKIVLAAWSPYFETVLTDGEPGKEHLTVSCENHEDAFIQLVDFMYCGRATINDSNVARLLSLADQFKVEPFTRHCEDFLKSNIHIKNFVTVFGLARRFRLKAVQENIATFVQQNLSEAAKQPEFNSLSPSWILAFIAMESMAVLKPEYKVFLIVGWISADFESREKYLALLFSKMTWIDLSNDFLLEISKSENFFTSNTGCLYLLLDSICKAGLPLGPYTENFQILREQTKETCNRLQVDKLNELTDDEPISAIHLFKQAKDKEVGYEHESGAVGDEEYLPPEVNNSPKGSHFEHSSGEEEETLMNIDSWAQLSFESNSPVKNGSDKSCRRSTRRKGIPAKVIDEAEYGVSPRGMSSPKLRGKQQENSQHTQAGAKIRRKRGRQPKTPKEEPVLEKSAPKADRNVKRRGRPKKLRVGENGEREKCLSGNFLKEDAPDDPSEDKPLSVRERNTWRKCDIAGCDFTATIIEAMEEHMVTVHEKRQTHCCNVCDFKSSYQRIYLTHMKIHFAGPPFCCDFEACTYKTERIQPLLTHRMIHTDEKPYECATCQAKFRSPIYLQVHERTHTGERPFECSICQRAFSTKGTLDMHSISHTNSRPYLCDTCGFATKYQSHLIAHKRIHTGEVFRCRYPNCSYSTPKRSLIKAHLRSHLGIRGHTCSTCGRAFVEKSHLVRHEKIHLDDKPFKCSLCVYSSTRRDKLKEHVSKHHSSDSPVAATPYKPHKNRRSKEPLPVPTLTDNATIVLEKMVESSSPSKSIGEVNNLELVNNIELLQREQRHLTELKRAEQRGKLQQQQQNQVLLPHQQCPVLRNSLSRDLPHPNLDSSGFEQHHHIINSVGADNLGTEEGQPVPHDGTDYSVLQTSGQSNVSLSQSLEHLQSPHVSVSILKGNGQLSQEAVAFVQSVADSVVLDAQPPIMSHSAQTTTMNNVTITTLEFIK